MSMFLVGLAVAAVGTGVLARCPRRRLGGAVWIVGFALIGTSQGWWSGFPHRDR